MKILTKFTIPAAIIGLCFAAAGQADAQISTINSVDVTTRELNDVPGATLTSFNLYPSVILFGETGVSAPTGFANNDTWQFSSDGGTSAYQFQNSDYFLRVHDPSVDRHSEHSTQGSRFYIQYSSVGTIQFIVDTDAHEVVQFGGISFYSFNANNIVSYNSGDTINLGLQYFKAPDGNNAVEFFANGNASPITEFAPGAGIGNGSTLGGYFQIANDPSNPAQWRVGRVPESRHWTGSEPSSLVLLGMGIAVLGVVVLRRRSLV